MMHNTILSYNIPFYYNIAILIAIICFNILLVLIAYLIAHIVFNTKLKKNNSTIPITKIYVAGSFHDKETIANYSTKLSTYGYTIVSGWINRENNLNKPMIYRKCADADFDEIDLADCVVAFLDDPKYPYRGTFTEIGYAIGKNKKVIICCKGQCYDDKENNKVKFTDYYMDNVFFWTSNIIHLNSVEDVGEYLNNKRKESIYHNYLS